MKTEEEGGHLQAKKRGLRRKQTCSTLILGFQPPELQENTFLLFKSPSLCYFVLAALANQYTTETSFYKREGKEFIPLFNKTLSDASHMLGLPLEAWGSVVNKTGRQQPGNQAESGSRAFSSSLPRHLYINPARKQGLTEVKMTFQECIANKC